MPNEDNICRHALTLAVGGGLTICLSKKRKLKEGFLQAHLRCKRGNHLSEKSAESLVGLLRKMGAPYFYHSLNMAQ